MQEKKFFQFEAPLIVSSIKDARIPLQVGLKLGAFLPSPETLCAEINQDPLIPAPPNTADLRILADGCGWRQHEPEDSALSGNVVSSSSGSGDLPAGLATMRELPDLCMCSAPGGDSMSASDMSVKELLELLLPAQHRLERDSGCEAGATAHEKSTCCTPITGPS